MRGERERGEEREMREGRVEERGERGEGRWGEAEERDVVLSSPQVL